MLHFVNLNGKYIIVDRFKTDKLITPAREDETIKMSA